MGVSGTVGVVTKNRGRLQDWIQLRDTPVVIDTTGAFYWYAKEKLLSKSDCDKYGCSMHDLGKLYWNLLTRLRERNCTPHIVFDGPRKSERFGPLISKVDYLRQSANGALRRLQNGQLGEMDCLPDLAINCLKEIIAEMDQGRNQIHTYQAEGEVYPTLVHLSKLHNAPVLTGHSDFIFQNVAAGFIWIEELVLPTNSTDPISCALYKHELFLRHFRLNASHSEALGCMCVMFRDDFAERYYDAINACLELEIDRLKMDRSVRRRRVKTARLLHVLHNWPEDLTSKSSVVRKLQRASSGNRMMRDFEAIWDCYFAYQDFSNSELATSLRQSNLLNYQQVIEALTKRETSVEFLANATLTNFNRTGIEDVQTFRSTFSLQDRVKQFLLSGFRSNSVGMFDRQRNSMQSRYLSCRSQAEAEMTSATLYEMFHFDQAKLDRLSSSLRDKNQIDAIICNELALLLLLASYALKLAPREDYSNQPEGSNVAPEQRYTKRQTRVKFLTAILNSYVYLQSRTNQGDQSSQDVPADIRVARQRVEAVANQAPSRSMSISDEAYITQKHLIECLNSVLHAYKELNSLYEFQGQKLPVNKYYDGVIIYKLMSRYSNNLQEYLLTLDDETLNELL